MLNFNEPTAVETTPQSGRASAITPLEMRQTMFASGWRGYSPQAVRTFLVDASESYELALRENERLEDAQREIDGLRLRRREAEANVEAIISSLHSTLEFIRDQQREPRVVPLRPRMEAAS